MEMVFLEAVNDFDVSFEIPMAYKQLKSYLYKYSKNKNKINMLFFNKVEDIKKTPDIVGVSATSQNFYEAIKIGKEVKSKFPKTCLVIGGHHISYFPETLPEEYDAGVMFEGEKTFLEIVDLIYENMDIIDGFENVKGIVYRNKKNKLIINRMNELIENLDSIPFPAAEGVSAPYVFSSRGCPYICTFCSSTKFWKKARFFSAEYIISEIEYIVKEYPDVKNITFWDDLAIADRKRLRELLDLIKNKKINERVSFYFSVRANLIDDEICRILKAINVSSVSFGAESGSDRILKKLKDKNMSVDINQKALDKLYEYNIPVSCSFIIGCPGETEEDAGSTFDFIYRNLINNKLTNYSINMLMPLPGTEMWNYAVENKIVNEKEIDWRKLQVFASYKDSKFSSIDEWIEERNRKDSFYLNEDVLPQKKLLRMLKSFEKKIDAMSNITYANSSKNNLYLSKDKNFYNPDSETIDTENNNSTYKYIIEKIEPESLVLDVGCATGYIGDWLVKNKKCNVYGIDFNETELEKLREKNIYKENYCIDLDLLDYDLYREHNKDIEQFEKENILFDSIIIADVLEHLKNPTGVLLWLSKKLKLNGNLLISIPEIGNIDIIIGLLAGGFNYNRYGILDNSHLRFFTEMSFIEWIESINEQTETGCKFNLELIGQIKYSPDYVFKIGDEFKSIMELNRSNKNLNVLQNIFCLTKVDEENWNPVNSNNFKRDFMLNPFYELKTMKQQFDHEMKKMKQEVESIYNSKSWRVTKPLRSMAAIIRKLRL